MNLLTPTRRSVLGLGLVTLILVPVAFSALFAGVTPYDDEGTMLVTLAGLTSRGAPYTDFYSQYGPFWLEVFGGPFAVLHKPLTHDAGRIVVLVAWLGSSALIGVAVQLLTGRLVLAMAAVLCAFKGLELLTAEPMHPSSLVALLLAAGVAAPVVLGRHPRAALAALGGIAAALALTKINAGGLFLVAVLYGLAVSHRGTGRRTELAAAGLLALLPVAIIAPDLGDRERAIECAVSVAGALALVVAGVRSDRLRAVTAPRPLAWLAVGVLVVGLPVLAIPLFLGTRADDLIEGVLLAPARQRTALSIPLVLPDWSLAWAGLSLGLAVLVRLRDLRAPEPLGAVARLLAGALIWVAILRALPTPGAGQNVLGFVIPLAWVAALPPRTPERPGAALGRAILPAAAVTATLQAYPVAGTQVWIGLFLFVAVGAVCIGDGIAELALFNVSDQRRSIASGRALGALAGIVLLLFTSVAVARRASDVREQYASWPKLRLKGTARVHAAPRDVHTLQAVVRQLDRRCTALITFPGMHSFDLWSGLAAPSGDNTTHWWSLLSRSQQRDTVARARQIPHLCVLRDDALVNWWSRFAPAPSRHDPLVRYIADDFTPTVSVGPYRLLERRGA